MRYTYQQLIYWSTVGYDVLLNGASRSYYVTGYAKSGTNWLCRLMSDYTGLPVFEAWKHSVPPLRPQIFHVMRLLPFETVRKRTVYVMRDGRDAIVSRYYETLHREPRHRRDVERFLGSPMTDDNIRANLPRFIQFMSTYQGGCADYKTHLTYWLEHHYVTLKYEDLLRDTAGALRRALSELTGREPDMSRVESAVKKNSFEAATKRARGEESKSAFLRKGISGDWKNYFTPEAARVFDAYAGDLLIRLGYENDRDWVRQVPGA